MTDTPEKRLERNISICTALIDCMNRITEKAKAEIEAERKTSRIERGTYND